MRESTRRLFDNFMRKLPDERLQRIIDAKKWVAGKLISQNGCCLVGHIGLTALGEDEKQDLLVLRVAYRFDHECRMLSLEGDKEAPFTVGRECQEMALEILAERRLQALLTVSPSPAPSAEEKLALSGSQSC